MKNKILSVFVVIMSLFLFPIVVSAGGADDDSKIDISFTYSLDRDNYKYGHIGHVATGSASREIVEKISDTEIYFYSTDFGNDENSFSGFSCKDKSYDRYQIIATGSDGNTYYGYGCRKPKNDDVIDWEERELLIGEGTEVGGYTGYTNKILDGDSVEYATAGPSTLEYFVYAKRVGTTKIRSVKDGTSLAIYYKFNVIEAYSKVSELDPNYDYASVNSCSLKAGTFTIGGKVNFDNLEFCGSSQAGYNYEMDSVSCKEKGYDPFKIAFNSDDGGTLYKGYGCRKLKETEEAENSIEYNRQDMFVGEKILIKISDFYECSVMSGDAGKLSEACELKGEKEGMVRIKAVNKSSNLPEYYEYNVQKAITSILDLDQTYNYVNINSCKITMTEGTASYSPSGIVEIDGVKFCGDSYNGMYEKYDYSCPSNYESFFVAIQKGDQIYRSYGCRQKLSEDNVLDDVCQSVPDSIINYIKEALKLIRWLGLALMIVLGTLDFVKAAAADDQDAMKKASQNFIKRLIAVIILFLLPIMIELILSILSMIGFDFAKCFHIVDF